MAGHWVHFPRIDCCCEDVNGLSHPSAGVGDAVVCMDHSVDLPVVYDGVYLWTYNK